MAETPDSSTHPAPMVRTGRMTVYKLDAMENGSRYEANSRAKCRIVKNLEQEFRLLKFSSIWGQ